MDDITNADMPHDDAEGSEGPGPRISPEAIWGSNGALQARPASAGYRESTSESQPAMTAGEPASPGAPVAGSRSDFRTWYPSVWSPWEREGAVDERANQPAPPEPQATPASVERTPPPQEVPIEEPVVEAEATEQDTLAPVAVAPGADADVPMPEPDPEHEEPAAPSAAFTWAEPVRDHPLADAWVIAPGAPSSQDWKVEAASAEVDEEDSFGTSTEPDEGFDPDEADTVSPEPAPLEDDRLQEIFDEDESLAAYTWAEPPAPEQRAASRWVAPDLPDQWVFTSKRFSGQKGSRTKGSRTSGPEPTGPGSIDTETRSGRFRGRRRDAVKESGVPRAEEPWPDPTPSTTPAMVGFGPEAEAGPEPHANASPGLSPVETMIPERRRGRGRHRRDRGSRPEPQARPPQHVPDEPREPSGAGAGGGVGGGPVPDLSGSLVVGSGGGVAMSSTIRLLAIALPLAAAAIAALSYLR